MIQMNKSINDSSHMENNIIATILSKLNTKIKHRVVFDIDDVLCRPITLSPIYSRSKEEIEKRIQKYPGATTIYWESEDDTYLHCFYPNLGKLMLSILSWDHWSIDFFSAGVKERNEEVIPFFLKRVLGEY